MRARSIPARLARSRAAPSAGSLLGSAAPMLRALLALALLSTACAAPPTQLVVVVRSDLPAADLAEVRVDVIPGEPFTAAPSTQTFVVGAGDGRVAIPFSFGILPRNGDPTSRVEITVGAYGAAGASTPVVTRVVRTGFSAGRALLVPVFLSAACRDRAPCEAGLTCDRGECVSPDVPVEDLDPVDPGRELEDAGTGPVDGGTSIGLPPPTRREIFDIASTIVAPNEILVDPSGDLFVLVGGAASGGAFGAPGTDREGGHVLRLSSERVPRWSRSFVGDTMVIAHGALSGDRLFVCGDFDGTLTPDGGAALTAVDDGVVDRDDAAFVAELDAATGALRWVSELAGGDAARCSDLAFSGDVLAVGVAGLSGALTLDGAPVTLGGCPPAVSALLRLDVSGATPRALPTAGFASTAGTGVSLDPDGAGGFLAAFTSFGAGDQVTGRCGSGAEVSGDVMRIDAAGARTWGTSAVTLTGFTGLGVDVARVNGAVVVMASTMEARTPAAIRVGDTEVSPTGTAPRVVVLGLSLASGAPDGRVRVGNGGALIHTLHAAGPDVLVCGLAPDGELRSTDVDFFGRTLPFGGTFSGYAVALGADLSARWLESVTADVSGYVTACAPVGDGSVWAGAVLTSSGTAFGIPASGGVLARLRP